ncbi:3-hydroxyisobutyrate dehydrogenase [Leptolyngbya sp. Heron Island J]|uniref:NAD(P)-dependent oxidoreductase n=1 Tax=Leptolyngbya sp. Heron Island J TaxID=1385935 RepID=UPI0003B9D567|nr:NAD(P)-dependent oxidoreductase [Leptolyngbya sp. Heron Island J]ESA38555.1 3-hydroxyisobutyrate dehydrogenase [Leptolyngbya sp. Heron Island J]
MTKVALLGTGAMGYRMAQNLLQTQHELIVYNRTADKLKSLLDQGAVYAATPKAAAEQADIVISMVTDDDSSRNIWLNPENGAVLGLSDQKIAIESSTLSVTWTQQLAATITSQGATFLDAPVVGSRPQAEAGKLIYLVGGNAETAAQVKSVLLSAGAATVHHVGATGQGMAMKLAVNALFGIQVAALAEMLGMLSQCGISPEKAMVCLGELPVTSVAAKGAGGLMVSNRHAPMFPIELVVKDFRYVLQTAQAVGASAPASQTVYDVYQTAIAQGYGDENITGVVQLFNACSVDPTVEHQILSSLSETQ